MRLYSREGKRQIDARNCARARSFKLGQTVLLSDFGSESFCAGVVVGVDTRVDNERRA